MTGRPSSTPLGPPRAYRIRAACALGAVMACLLGLPVALVHIQFVRGEFFRELGRQQYVMSLRLSARRGEVRDRKGRLLACSVERWSVYADPQTVAQPQRTAALLGRALEMGTDQVLQRLRRPGRFAWIKRQVSPAEAEAVRALRLEGVYLERESKRFYPHGSLAAHVVGFTDIDGRGLAGVELKLDRLLAGKPGFDTVRCDGGRRIFKTPEDRVEAPPCDGYDVWLTIDAYIQDVAEEELARAAELHRPECAAAVVMDPRSGEVLALASWPTFDPQRPGQSPIANQRNVAVAEAYEFGSVLKPLTVGLALDRGIVTADEQFDCHHGQWQVGSRVVHDVHPYGTLSVSDIICHSSNIGVAQIGLRLGAEGLHRGLEEFGLGQPTGIALPGEASGILRPLRRWNNYSVISASFGQEVSTTPLALARAYCAVANGGLLLQPRIVKRILDPRAGTTIYEAGPPAVVGRPLRPSTARLLLRMMRRVVEEGTGRRARLAEYAIAGKTGTAQLARTDGRGYAKDRYVSSFVAIAPADEPRVVVLVTLKAPSRGGYYGGVCAAPAAREIVRRTLRYLGVPPQRSQPVLAAESRDEPAG